MNIISTNSIYEITWISNIEYGKTYIAIDRMPQGILRTIVKSISPNIQSAFHTSAIHSTQSRNCYSTQNCKYLIHHPSHPNCPLLLQDIILFYSFLQQNGYIIDYPLTKLSQKANVKQHLIMYIQEP